MNEKNPGLTSNGSACANIGGAIRDILKKNPDEIAKMAVCEYVNIFIDKNRRLLELARQCNTTEKNKEVKDYFINIAKSEIEKIKSIDGLQSEDINHLEIFEKEIEVFIAQ